MNFETDIRRVLKKFRCEKCGNFFKKLVEPHDDFTQCENKEKCDWMAEEISDSDYKKLKEIKQRVGLNNNSNQPNINNINSNQGTQSNQQQGNFFNQNFSYNNNTGNNQRSNNNNQGRRIFAEFDNFFPGMGINISNQQNPFGMNSNMNMMSDPFSIFNTSFFNGIVRNPVRGRVNRIVISQDNFDPDTFIYGSSFNDVFRDNYSSNFHSNFNDQNFRGDFLEEIFRYMQQRSEDDGVRPTDKKALEKLKRFKLDETHCKKDNNGKLEYPQCIICITDIEKGSDTLLIPCGHMFHEPCIKSWLDKHNTCPVCRFELPTS